MTRAYDTSADWEGSGYRWAVKIYRQGPFPFLHIYRYSQDGSAALMRLKLSHSDVLPTYPQLMTTPGMKRRIQDAFEQLLAEQEPEQVSDGPMRELLTFMQEPPPTAKRLIGWASALGVEHVNADEWGMHLQDLTATRSRAEVIGYAIGYLYAGLHSRVIWIAGQVARPATAALCWALRSQFRTWAALSALLLWAGVETAADTGIGAAILVVLVAFSGLVWLVVRNRYDAHPPREKESPPDQGK